MKVEIATNKTKEMPPIAWLMIVLLSVRAALFYFLFILLSAIMLVLFIFSYYLAPNWLEYRASPIWGKLTLVLVRRILGIDCVVRGRENLPTTPSVILCQHQSAWETIAMLELLPNPAFVTKKELLSIPIFGWGLALSPIIAVDRTQGRLALAKLLREGGSMLSRGHCLIVFPEGTRVPIGETIEYKSGGAAIALKNNVPVVPVALNSGRLWPPSLLYKRPGVVSVSFGQPVTGKNSDEITQRARQWIVAESNNLENPVHMASTSNLIQALKNTVAERGWKHMAIEELGASYSYRRLIMGALGLGRFCKNESEPNERVGILLPNVFPHLALIYGLWGIGRIPVELNFTMGPASLISACKTAQLKIVITSRKFVEKGNLQAKIDALPVRIIYLEDVGKSIKFTDKLWVMWHALSPWRIMHQPQPTDEAFVLFTSGTEGTPKGVSLSHGALLANIAQIRERVQFTRGDRFLASMPLFHCFGLTGGVLLPLLSGCHLLLYPTPLNYKIIPRIIREQKCDVLFGTSTFLMQYARQAEPDDLKSLRFVVAGAEKLAAQTSQLWRDKFGLEILEGYGVTEGSPVLAVNDPAANRPGTVGRLLDGIEFYLEPVPGVEKGGILHVRGANIMTGYLRESKPGVVEPTSSSHGPGWYSTGDVVDMDAEGNITIIGRLKRFAKVAGEMVSLNVVENLAMSVSPEAEHACATRPHQSRGEEILLYTTDAQLTREKLQKAAKEKGWPEFMTPRKVVAVEALPILASGKVDYQGLQALAQEQEV